jgi:hypothetical protein
MNENLAALKSDKLPKEKNKEKKKEKGPVASSPKAGIKQPKLTSKGRQGVPDIRDVSGSESFPPTRF